MVEQFKSGLLPVPSQSTEEMLRQLCIKTVKERRKWDRKSPTIFPNQSEGLLHLLRPSSRRGNVISTVSPSDSCHPLSHRPHAPILNAGNTKYFTETKVRSTSILNDDHEEVRTYFPTAFEKNYQNELFPYSSVTETTTSFTSYDYSDTETTHTVRGLSALNTAGTTEVQQSSHHLRFLPQHEPPTPFILCRSLPQPPTITTIQQHPGSTLVYAQSHTSAPLYASSFCHQTPSLTSHSNSFSNSTSGGPTEFYARDQRATNNDTRTRNRNGQGGCGLEPSTLIFLNSRGTNYRATQNKARREEPSFSWGTIEIPASERRCCHLLSQPHISGQELFSVPPKRNIAQAKQEPESNNKLTLQYAARDLTDVAVSEHVQVMETHFMKDTKVTGPTVTKISVLPSETQQKQKTGNENVQSKSKKERENPSNELTLIEKEHFPSFAAIDLKRKSSSPTVTTKAWMPFQTTVSSEIPHQPSSTARVTGKPTASSPECRHSSVNKSRKIYSDVHKNKITATPSAAVSGNCMEGRYEELQQQDSPTEENRSESFQQQKQQTAEDSNPRISEVTVNYYRQFI